jgi:hypothetical protein
MMDTVAAGLAAKSGDRFAYDSYRRFLDMFGNVVSTTAISANAALTRHLHLHRRIGDQLACQAISSDPVVDDHSTRLLVRLAR